MNDVKLTDTQDQAVKSIKHWYKHQTHVQPWFYLAGFAGVGKTTVLKYVLAELGLTAEGMTPDVVAACYTAKASLVLTRAGVPATTIHRLIYNVKHVADKQIHDKEAEIQKLEFQVMGGEPGLAFVLGAIIGQDRVGKMTFQQLRAPSFPLAHKLHQFLDTLGAVMPAQHFCRAGW